MKLREESAEKWTILLASEEQLQSEELARALSPHFEIIGVLTDGRELQPATLRLKPDLVLLDVALQGLNGIEAARQLKKTRPDVLVLLNTMHADSSNIQAVLNTGPSGYILKYPPTSELIEAIEQVLSGRTYVTPRVLTAREREILQWVAEGKSAKEIAFLLHISPKTVAFHKTNIMEKLRAHSTAELTKYAIRHGLAGG